MTSMMQRVIGVSGLVAVIGVAAATAYPTVSAQSAGTAQRIAAAFQGPGPGGPGGRGAFGPGGRGPMGAGRMGGPGGPLAGLPLGRLELTDAQREQVRNVMESHRAASEAIGKRMMAARQALDAAIVSETYDEGTVRARAADVANVEADAAVQRAQIFQEVWRLLTPEQQKQAKEFQQRAADRPRPGAGRRGGRL